MQIVRSLFLAGLLMSIVTGCGSHKSADQPASTAPVAVTIETGDPGANGLQASSGVPPAVTSVTLEVSGDGIDPTLSRTLTPAPGEAISITLDVPLGLGRIFTATAYDADLTVLFRGQTVADVVGGEPLAVMIELVPLDHLAPTVLYVLPGLDATNVSTTAAIEAHFSEALDANTVTATAVTLVQGASAVPASVTYNAANRSITLQPDTALALDTVYTATLSTSLTDISGNLLAQAFVWSFTTTATTGVGVSFPPVVTATLPIDQTSAIAVNTAVTATFSGAMDPSSISTSTFWLQSAGGMVAAAVSYDAPSKTATFTPSAPLAYSTTYFATVSMDVTDAGGHALGQDFTWSFATRAAVISSFAVTVTADGDGSGSVTSAPAGISCPPTCQADFPDATVVTLSQQATGPGSVFDGWGDACSGLGADCTLTANAPTTVTARFDAVPATGGSLAVALGLHHTCAVAADQSVYCWGRNESGQLGNGTTQDSAVPALVPGLKAGAIATGDRHTCAVINDGTAQSGTIQCWGANDSGQLGDGSFTDSSSPVTVASITDATAVAAGSLHTCALLSDGTVACWGNNADGELGQGGGDNANAPVAVANISGGAPADTATALVAGSSHVCALLADGGVSCWGYGGAGQLGTGQNASEYTPAATGITNAVAITAGSDHTCALLADQSASCWGYNRYGQLGDGQTSDSNSPVLVSVIGAATAIAGGYNHTCAALVNGTVNCWGANNIGQLGNGSINDSVTAVPVTGITTATAVAAGSSQACAVLPGGLLRCWGGNVYGELGFGVFGYFASPVLVQNLTGAQTLSAGTTHTCATLADDTARCWGYNRSGRLGDGTTQVLALPVSVQGLTQATGVAAGNAHSCAVRANGSVRCWGANQSGQLGNNSNTTSLVPVAVSNITTATAVTTGAVHSCALLLDGTVACWGSNASGQLGDGTGTDSSVPVAVSGLDQVVGISAGADHTCAVRSDGSAWCWGSDQLGQLGNGGNSDAWQPVAVNSIVDAIAISAGLGHTCALLSDHSLSCWGDNASGQLGDGSTNSTSTPVSVTTAGSIAAIGTGAAHSCALLTDGTLECWGANDRGQLGDGTLTSSSSPQAVPGLSTVTALAVGANHACAILADGSVRCWGSDAGGQLGNGIAGCVTLPQTVAGF